MYSDRSIEELLAWGEDRGLKPEWVDRKNVLPHYDVLGRTVAEHEPGVERAELVHDIRWWRDFGTSARGGEGSATPFTR